MWHMRYAQTSEGGRQAEGRGGVWLSRPCTGVCGRVCSCVFLPHALLPLITPCVLLPFIAPCALLPLIAPGALLPLFAPCALLPLIAPCALLWPFCACALLPLIAPCVLLPLIAPCALLRPYCPCALMPLVAACEVSYLGWKLRADQVQLLCWTPLHHSQPGLDGLGHLRCEWHSGAG